MGHSLAGIAAVLGIPDWKTVIAFWPYFAGGTVAAYGLGSIPFGLVLARIFGHGDIRKIGSGNIGATNVLRTGSKSVAALTLVLDLGKGAAALWLARHFLGGPDVAFFAGFAVVLGHMFPVWLLFRGGKGVATTLGVILGLSLPAGLTALGVWLAVALISRISSLAALVAVAGAPLACWFFSGRQAATLAAILAVLVWLKHGANIARLLRGQEAKIKLK